MSKKTHAESPAYVAQREQTLRAPIEATAEWLRKTAPAHVAEWKDRVEHFKQMEGANAR